ncbi:MAG: hypothetical protein M3039_09355, partial [Acinetobacter baumannii]|nr:hypothetical protein [Acinetobacter baumannii]
QLCRKWNQIYRLLKKIKHHVTLGSTRFASEFFRIEMEVSGNVEISLNQQGQSRSSPLIMDHKKEK